MKVTAVLEAEVESPADGLIAELHDLEARHSPVIVLVQVLAQRGSVPATKIRVAEVHVNGEAR